MLSIAGPKEAAGVEDQYRFLICIESFIERVRSLPPSPDFSQFTRDILGIMRQHFGNVFRSLLTSHPGYYTKAESQSISGAASSIYLPQLVEALIGAIVLAVAKGDIHDDPAQLDILIYVYKYVPINPRYAFYGLNRFLETRLDGLGIDLNELTNEAPSPKLAAL